MFEQYIKMPHVIRRLKKYRFKSVLYKYIDYLIKNGYSKTFSHHYRNAVEHFFQWLEFKKVKSLKKVDQSVVNQFIDKHIPVCNCPLPAPKRRADLHSALMLLLRTQPEKFRQKLPSVTVSMRDKVIFEFDHYLTHICGLAKNTRTYHRRNTQIFLAELFKRNPVDLNQLTVSSIRQFIYRNLQHYKRRTLCVFIYSIRCFLKFLQFKGLECASLIAALPNIVEWKAAGLPESLNTEELDLFLNIFDRTTPLGKRDYAMVMIILELGLRAHEVSSLKLDDINWRSKTFYLPRGKTRQPYILPMTQAMILPLIDYLRYGRPKTDSRQVFVYHRAPVGKGIMPKMVTEVIRRAFHRAGLTPRSPGAHLLRRVFATHLLQQGASIKEIADLLRHKSIEITTIYTKVDIVHLAQVALPWPKELL